MNAKNYLQDFRDTSGQWFFAWLTEMDAEVAVALYPYSATHDSKLYYYAKQGRSFDDIRRAFANDFELVESGELYLIEHDLLTHAYEKRA